ncbi:MAG: hypothetical protein ABI220_05500 [Candidatus Saccharimonadales bacterium]
MTGDVMSPRAVHEVLTTNFTDRYIQRSHLGPFAHSVGYDSDNPLCDYEKTWWEALPNKWSESVSTRIVSKMNRLSLREFGNLFVEPLAERAETIKGALHDFPVAFINGHSLDLQAALPLVAASIGIAHSIEKGDYRQNLEDMIRLSHGVATRALAPIILGRERFTPRLPFMRIAQLAVNAHLSFPVNKQMNQSSIPKKFTHDYNVRLKENCVGIAKSETTHPLGFKTLWALSPGGTPDTKVEESSGGEIFTKRIEPATVDFIARLGCGLLPVYTSFGKCKSPTAVEFGDIIPPNLVNVGTLSGIMTDLAAFRRKHGEGNVYYEGERAV